jgi:hypothetical protein
MRAPEIVAVAAFGVDQLQAGWLVVIETSRYDHASESLRHFTAVGTLLASDMATWR